MPRGPQNHTNDDALDRAISFFGSTRLVRDLDRARDRVREATGLRPSRSQVVRAAIERGLRLVVAEVSP